MRKHRTVRGSLQLPRERAAFIGGLKFLLLRSCRKRSAAASAVTRGHAPRFEFQAFSAKRNDHCLNATTLAFASPLNPKAPFPEHG
jgi:hypothetical protein